MSVNPATVTPHDGWIGTKPTPAAIAALLVIGIVGMQIVGVQPVLLGALFQEQRLTAPELGWATTAEYLALGLSMAFAGAVLKPRGLKVMAAAAALVVLAVDLLVMEQSGIGIVINRGLAGLGEGLLYWIAVCMFTRSPTPALWYGVFIAVLSLVQLAFTAVVPPTVMAQYGANGGFAALGAMSLLVLLAVPFIPSELAELPAQPEGTSRSVFTSPTAIASLFSVFLIGGFSVGIFVYLEPLSQHVVFDPKTVSLAVSGALGAGIVGSIGAALIAKRISYFPALVATLVGNVAVLIVLNGTPSAPMFIVAGAVLGFFWFFFMPFQVPQAIEADPTRRIAVLVPGAQLLGNAAGPLLCSFFVTDSDARGLLPVMGVCLLTAFVIAAVLHARHRRGGDDRQQTSAG